MSIEGVDLKGDVNEIVEEREYVKQRRYENAISDPPNTNPPPMHTIDPQLLAPIMPTPHASPIPGPTAGLTDANAVPLHSPISITKSKKLKERRKQGVDDVASSSTSLSTIPTVRRSLRNK